MVARGEFPPPDKVRSLLVTFVEMEPSALRTSVGSRDFHVPSTCLRTAASDWVRVKVPLGCAVTVVVSVVAAPACTSLPVRWACSEACSVLSDVAARLLEAAAVAVVAAAASAAGAN